MAAMVYRERVYARKREHVARACDARAGCTHGAQWPALAHRWKLARRGRAVKLCTVHEMGKGGGSYPHAGAPLSKHVNLFCSLVDMTRVQHSSNSFFGVNKSLLINKL